MSGATAEKASPLESVPSLLKTGGIDVDQIVYAPPDDPLLVLRRRLSPLGIVQQQPRDDFPLLRSRRPQVPSIARSSIENPKLDALFAARFVLSLLQEFSTATGLHRATQ